MITGIQCATSNHPMRQIWRMRHRLAIPGLQYTRKLQNVLCGKVKPMSSGGFTLYATHLVSINHINAFQIWNIILRTTDFCLLFLASSYVYTISHFVLGRSAAQMTPSPSCKRHLRVCFVVVPHTVLMLVRLQSNCVSSLSTIYAYTFCYLHKIMLVFFHVRVFLVRAMSS